MSKKVHFSCGCPWADGSIQQADTNQTCDWAKVTCKHCRRLKSQNYGAERRLEISGEWNEDGTKPMPDKVRFYSPFCYMDKNQLRKEIERLCF